jgi:hypothetical protein
MIKFGESNLAEAIELFELGYGKQLTQLERHIFISGWNAGRVSLRGELEHE